MHLNASFWMDEAAQVLESLRPFHEQLNISKDFQPPLLHLYVHFLTIFSQAEWFLRFFAALLPSLGAFYFFYLVFKREIGEKASLIAIGMLAVSSFSIFYSQELRPYALSLFFASLSLFYLEKVIEKNNLFNLLLLIIFNTLGFYTSYVYLFFIFSEGLYLLLKKKVKITGITLASISLLYLPWLPFFLIQLKTGQILRTLFPGWDQVVSLTQLKAIPLVLAKFIYGVIDIEFSPIFIISTLLMIFLVIYLFISKKIHLQISKKYLLIFFFTFIPLCLCWLFSFIVPVISPKRLIFIEPFFFAAIALLIVDKYKQFKAVSNLLLIIIYSIQIISTYKFYTDKKYQREDWRSLQQEISSLYQTNDTILLFAFEGPISAWQFYDQNHFPTWSTGVYYLEDTKEFNLNLATVNQYNRIIIFDYLRNLTDPSDLLIKKVEAFGYDDVKYIDYPNIGFVRVYEKKL